MQGNGSAGTAASAGQVREQILIVLQAWGMAPDLAAITAGLMAETDLLGIDSHGISMLPSYEEKLRAGTLRLDARPRLVRDGGASALLDGMGGLGYPVSAQAMNLAVDKALEHGVGAVSVCNSHHFGAAGVYARIAVERGVVGLVTSSANGVIMVPTRGAMPMLGTNPIAFGAPAAHNEPFVLTWPPPPWRPTRSRCTTSSASRCRRAGRWTGGASRSPRPIPPCSSSSSIPKAG